MQKSDLIRSRKWAMEDAFLREVGATSRAATSMRYWDEPWEISPENRDRPGGHQTQHMSGWNGWKKSKYAKRKQNKKMRREHRKITAEAVREFYQDQEYWSVGIHNWYDEFEPTSKEQIYYEEWLDDQIEYQQMVMDWNNLDMIDMIDDEERWREFDKEMEDLYDFMYD